MRVDPETYKRLELRAHSLLAEVPLHDVWAVDLPGCGRQRSVLELRDLLSVERLSTVSTPVRLLFAVRNWLGQLLGWDRESPTRDVSSFVERLSAADRESSLVEPGTADGPFRVLYVSTREAISEIRNATVHAFSVFALIPTPPDYRLYWAIYVRPLGPITTWYMRLIDPFRRFIVYPAVLRYIGKGWKSERPTAAV